MECYCSIQECKSVPSRISLCQFGNTHSLTNATNAAPSTTVSLTATVETPRATQTTARSSGAKASVGIIAGGVVAGVTGGLVLLGIALFCARRYVHRFDQHYSIQESDTLVDMTESPHPQDDVPAYSLVLYVSVPDTNSSSREF